MRSCCSVWQKFDLENNLIKEFQNWIVLLGTKKKTLGYCVAITKKHHESIADLSPVEMAEYQVVAKVTENALTKAFVFDKIHHLMLMSFDKHTHFHIYPRYKTPREFAGLSFLDDFKPNPLGKDDGVLSIDTRKQIIKEIQKYL